MSTGGNAKVPLVQIIDLNGFSLEFEFYNPLAARALLRAYSEI